MTRMTRSTRFILRGSKLVWETLDDGIAFIILCIIIWNCVWCNHESEWHKRSFENFESEKKLSFIRCYYLSSPMNILQVNIDM